MKRYEKIRVEVDEFVLDAMDELALYVLEDTDEDDSVRDDVDTVDVWTTAVQRKIEQKKKRLGRKS